MPGVVGYVRKFPPRGRWRGPTVAAQRARVDAFAAGLPVLAFCAEDEARARRAGRPALADGLARARRSGARLVVAAADRLGRDAAFLAALRDGGADFVCLDDPLINPGTVPVL